MGNTHQQLPQVQNTILHPRLGYVKFITQTNNLIQKNRLIQFVSTVNSQIEYQQWVKTKQRMFNSQLKQVLFLPYKQQYLKQGMCGTSGKVRLTFQNYFYVLQNEIRNRESLIKPFLQTQLWYLLYTIIRASKQFQKYDKKLGDIQPNNILINSDGQVKIISSLSWPSFQINTERIMQNKIAKAFLAPEQLLEANGKFRSFFHIKSTVAENFSIGLTLLQATSLKNCSQIYIRQPEIQIDLQRLKNYKQKIREKYSFSLVRIIFGLLQINERIRLTSGQIYNLLLPYEQKILNLQHFSLEKNIQQFNKIINNKYIEQTNFVQKNSMNKNINIPIKQYNNVKMNTKNQTILMNQNIFSNHNQNRVTFNNPKIYKTNSTNFQQQKYFSQPPPNFNNQYEYTSPWHQKFGKDNIVP